MTEQTKFSTLFFTKALGDALVLPFLSLYLVSLNFTGSQLGFALSLGPIVGLLANPFWGAMSKDIRKTKTMIRNLLLILGVIYFSFTYIKSYEGIILLLIILPFFSSPLGPLIDSFGVTFCNLNNIKFSKVRIGASFGFMITTFFGGIIAKYAGYNMNFYLAAIFIMISTLIVKRIKQLDISKNDDKREGSFIEVLTNNEFIKYLTFYIFVLGSGAIADSYFGIYLEEINVDSSFFGILTSIGVLAEIIAMRYLMTRGIKLKDNIIFLLLGCILMIRVIALSLGASFIVTIIVSILKGFAIGVFLTYHMDYIFKIVRVNNLTIATFILFISNSLFLAIFNNISGYVYEFYGINKLYILVSILGIIGLLVTPFFKGDKIIKEEY